MIFSFLGVALFSQRELHKLLEVRVLLLEDSLDFLDVRFALTTTELLKLLAQFRILNFKLKHPLVKLARALGLLSQALAGGAELVELRTLVDFRQRVVGAVSESRLASHAEGAAERGISGRRGLGSAQGGNQGYVDFLVEEVALDHDGFA